MTSLIYYTSNILWGTYLVFGLNKIFNKEGFILEVLVYFFLKIKNTNKIYNDTLISLQLFSELHTNKFQKKYTEKSGSKSTRFNNIPYKCINSFMFYSHRLEFLFTLSMFYSFNNLLNLFKKKTYLTSYYC